MWECETAVAPISVLVVEYVFLDDTVGAACIETQSSSEIVRATVVLSPPTECESDVGLIGDFVSIAADIPFVPSRGIVFRVYVLDDIKVVYIEQPPLSRHQLVTLRSLKLHTNVEPLVDVLTEARGVPSLASVTWRSVLPCQIR